MSSWIKGLWTTLVVVVAGVILMAIGKAGGKSPALMAVFSIILFSVTSYIWTRKGKGDDGGTAGGTGSDSGMSGF